MQKRCCPHQTDPAPPEKNTPSSAHFCSIAYVATLLVKRKMRSRRMGLRMWRSGCGCGVRNRFSPIDIDENDVQLQFVGFCCIFQGKIYGMEGEWVQWQGALQQLRICKWYTFCQSIETMFGRDIKNTWHMYLPPWYKCHSRRRAAQMEMQMEIEMHMHHLSNDSGNE